MTSRDRRLYFKVSVGYTSHPKIVAVGEFGAMLHLSAIDYCRLHGTDGVISERELMRLTSKNRPRTVIEAIRKQGLLHNHFDDCERCPKVTPGNYMVHDYLEHQLSRQELADLGKRRSDAGSAGGRAKARNLANGVANATGVAKQTASKSLALEEIEKEKELSSKDIAESPIRRPSPSVDASFDEFWSHWLDKRGKAEARKALAKALKITDLATIIAGVDRYMGDPNRDPGYTKLASTWLTKECWDDPPLPSRGGRAETSRQMILPGQACHEHPDRLATNCPEPHLGDDE